MRHISFLFFLVFASNVAISQDFVANYDESKIPDYVLPSLLLTKSGSKVATVDQWEKVRKKELLDDFAEYVYGKNPEGDIQTKTTIINQTSTLGGKAILKEVKMTFSKNNHELSMNILIIVPKSSERVPLFVGLNFY